LQDFDRAVIIGQRTYGKGLVQSTRPLSYNCQLKLTTAKYYIPSGRCIQAIDYSHRNEDGSVAYVPDSLRKEFRTKNDRKVYDGGGITPDIALVPDTFSKIAFSLVTKDIIFDFATYFAQHNASVPRNFKVSDELYNQFLTYIKDKDFDYQTKSEEMLEKLMKESKKEAYYDNLKTDFDNLKVKLSHNKNNDLQRYKSEICELIASEIISRYYYQWGRSEYLASIDPEVKKAVAVLQNRNEYVSILNPALVVKKPVKGKIKKK
jgi:carboxyl-terminal processing protease